VALRVLRIYAGETLWPYSLKRTAATINTASLGANAARLDLQTKPSKNHTTNETPGSAAAALT